MGAWTAVASLDDFAASDAIEIDSGGREIAIFLIGGAVFATANRCTHGDAKLCEGFLEGHEIECPFHQGRFDVRTGAATCAPAELALATYPARLDGDRVELELG
jgi:naphthalene 1,2-dioxygenase system ferredoxin subunit